MGEAGGGGHCFLYLASSPRFWEPISENAKTSSMNYE